MIGSERLDDDLDPVLHGLLTAAYEEPLDVDVAARHLFTLHHVAVRQHSSMRYASLRLTSVAAMAFAILLGLSGTISTYQQLPEDPAGSERQLAATEGAADERPIIAPAVLAPSAELQARVLLVHGTRRIVDAEMALPIRPQSVPDMVGDAVQSLERAEHLGGPALEAETAPIREAMNSKVVQLAGSSNLDEAGRAKLMVYSLRLTGSGEDPDDPVLVTRRRDRLNDQKPADAEPASDEVPAGEPDEPAAEPAPDETPTEPAPSEPTYGFDPGPSPAPEPAADDAEEAADTEDTADDSSEEADPAEDAGSTDPSATGTSDDEGGETTEDEADEDAGAGGAEDGAAEGDAGSGSAGVTPSAS
jgi:hypothetical protein